MKTQKVRSPNFTHTQSVSQSLSFITNWGDRAAHKICCAVSVISFESRYENVMSTSHPTKNDISQVLNYFSLQKLLRASNSVQLDLNTGTLPPSTVAWLIEVILCIFVLA
jgi:hypothetical protein